MEFAQEIEQNFAFIAKYRIPYQYLQLAKKALDEPLNVFIASLNPNEIDIGTRVYAHVREGKLDQTLIRKWETEGSYPYYYPSSSSLPTGNEEEEGQIYSFARRQPSDSMVYQKIFSYYQTINQERDIFTPLPLTQRLVQPGQYHITNKVVHEVSYQFDFTEVMNSLSPYQIINNAVMSPEIPLVLLKIGDHEPIYRVYTGVNSENIPSVSNVTEDGIYFYFATSGCSGNKIIAQYIDSTKQFYLTIPSRSDQRVKCDISQSIEQLNHLLANTGFVLNINDFSHGNTNTNDVGVTMEGKESGVYYFVGFNNQVDLSRFALMMQRNPPYNYFLALRETVYQSYHDAKMAFDYRDARHLITGKFTESRFKCNLTQYYAKSHEILYLEKTVVEIPPESYFFALKYTNVPSGSYLTNLVTLVKKLLSSYLLSPLFPLSPSLDGKSATSNNLSPSGAGIGSKNLSQVLLRETQKGGSNLEILKTTVPDLFISPYYSKDCNRANQPLPLAPGTNVESSNTYETDKEGNTYQRMILYPNPQIEPNLAAYAHYYYCPNPKYPVPGLKRNKDRKKSQFLYYPCCYETARAQSEGNTYHRYLTDPEHSTPIKRSGDVKTKILSLGQSGELYSEIEKLLGVKGQRYCVSEDVNSFLHTIAYIVSTEYRRIFETEYNPGILNKLATNLMATVRQRILPGVLRQELYDLSFTTLCEVINKDNEVYTSYEHFRMFEVAFGINIFVFRYQNQILNLEIARHQYFSVRNPVSQYSLVLILNDQNYYEIVSPIAMSGYERVGGNFLFTSPNQTNVLFELYNAVNNKYLLLGAPPSSLPSSLPSFPGDSQEKKEGNSLYLGNLANILGSYVNAFAPSPSAGGGREGSKDNVPLYQFIDSYGKMRGFVLLVNGHATSMLFHPSQPLNLPTIDHLPQGLYEDVLTLLDIMSPSSASLDSSRLGAEAKLSRSLDPPGVFAVFNEYFEFYFPLGGVITPPKGKSWDTLPLSNKVPYLTITYTQNSGDKITTLEMSKLANLVWQLIRFALIFYALDKNEELNDALAKKFIASYLRITPTTYEFHDRPLLPPSLSLGDTTVSAKDSSLPGAPSLPGGNLSPPGKLKEYLQWIEDNYPSIGDQHGFKMSSEKLKQKIEQRILRYTPHIRPHSTYQLVGLYDVPGDFQARNDELVFTDSESFNYWLKQEKEGYDLPIKTVVERKDALGLQSYLLLVYSPLLVASPLTGGETQQEGMIAMIVNTRRGEQDDYTEAVYLSAYWQKYRVNLQSWNVGGTQTEKLRLIEQTFGRVPEVCIYLVRDDGYLDLPNPKPNCVPIIKYDDYKFAAMMVI